MTPKLRRRLNRHINSIRFDLIESDATMADYRLGGEYQALLWLKAYAEDRASAEPRELLASCLRSMLDEPQYQNPKHQAAYLLTLLPYVE